MLGAPHRSLASLVGSIGVHACALLTFTAAARRAPPPHAPAAIHGDAWVGNAVEVDALNGDEAPAAASEATRENAEQPASTDSAPQPAPSTEVITAEHASSATPVAAPHPRTATRTAVTSRDSAEQRNPQPKKHAPASSNSSHDAPAVAGSALEGGNGGGVVGAQGLPPGVRSLPSAFTRAIPAAVSGDPLWQSLPVGAQSPFTIAVELAEGKLLSAEIQPQKPGSAVPSEVTHLRDRVLALLGGGGFALSSENHQSGRDVLRIQVTLSDRGAQADDDEPARLVERGFDPPEGARAGRAYFTLASGRHFEARVQIVSTRAARD